MGKILLGLVIIFGIGLMVVRFLLQETRDSLVVGTDNFSVAATQLFGTAAIPFGLGQNLVGSGSSTLGNVYVMKGCDKVVGSGAYTPQENNAYAVVLLEGSMDNGSNYFPLPTRVAGTTEIDVYADGGTGMGAASSGIPFVFPGDKTSVAGRGVTSTIFELEQAPYTHLRVSVKEQYTSTSGTLWMQVGCAR